MKKKYAGAYRALKQVARLENVTVEYVIEEIEHSIRLAYAECIKRGDQEALEKWRRIPCEGELPTALELVEHLGGRLG